MSSSIKLQKRTSNLKAWFSDNSIVLQSSENINANVSLISIDGKNHGILHDGMLLQGNNTLRMSKRLKRGIYVLSIQTRESRDSLKIVF